MDCESHGSKNAARRRQYGLKAPPSFFGRSAYDARSTGRPGLGPHAGACYRFLDLCQQCWLRVARNLHSAVDQVERELLFADDGSDFPF